MVINLSDGIPILKTMYIMSLAPNISGFTVLKRGKKSFSIFRMGDKDLKKYIEICETLEANCRYLGTTFIISQRLILT